MKTRRLIGLLTLTLTLASCSVKEDRSECPCWLTVDVSKIDADFCSILNTRCFTDLEEQFSDTINVRVFQDSTYERTVKRGVVDLTFWKGHESALKANDVIGAVSLGNEADSLYAGRFENDFSRKEITSAKASLHKQFATIGIDFRGYVQALKAKVVVESNYNGLDIKHFTPASGSYRRQLSRAGESGDDAYLFNSRLLRQGEDTKLYLKFYGTGNTKDNPSWTADLGAMLREIGYDWTKEDLEDIRFIIDGYNVGVQVEDWDEIILFEFNYGKDPDPTW